MDSSPTAATEDEPQTSSTTRIRSSSLVSPNAVPPRTSSSGLNYKSHRSNHQASNSFSAFASSSKPNTDTSTENPKPPPSNTVPAFISTFVNPLADEHWVGSSSSANKQGKQPERSRQYQLQQQPPQPIPPRSSRRPGQGVIIMPHQNESSGSPDPVRYSEEDLDFQTRGTWNEDKERIIRRPFEYILSHPGKDIRSQLIAAFNSLLNVPPDSLKIITKVVGMLHESSLLVDDVQDSSELRRGYPVAHNIFGVAQTINSANYVYFAALQELGKLGNQTAIPIFAEELLNLHRGQGMDLFWRDTLTCPTEEDYLEMVNNKTGGLFRLGVKLMQAESKSTVNCIPIVDIIGLIFQIRDDYMNLSSSEYSHNKGLCEDLTEGKFSFPIIHSIRADPTDLQLISILRQKTTDVQVKRYAVSYMESKGSFEYSRQVVDRLIRRARNIVDELDGGSGRGAGIHKILDKMTIS